MLRSYRDKMVREPDRDKRTKQKNNHPRRPPERREPDPKARPEHA